MFRTLTALALLTCLPATAMTQPARPALIVAISVDQFSGDLFNQYRGHFTGGLARLTQGAVFPRGYQSHAATETCPGHSTILTGARPARTGIIANNWIDQSIPRPDKTVYCAEDESVPGSSSSAYTVSPLHLKVPTLGERMKAADPASRSVAVAGKDRAAVMMAGQKADAVWWWKDDRFTSYAAATPRAAVHGINAAVASRLARARPASALPAICAAQDHPVPVGAGRNVGTGRFAREGGNAKAFRASPELDGATLDLATALIDEMRLGQRTGHSDIIAIGLSATDYIGHSYGTAGSEMCIQMAALDRALGAFLDRLDRSGTDYVVALTADHGGHDLPERNAANAVPDAARVDAALNPAAINAALQQRLGLGQPPLLADGAAGDWYLAAGLSPADRQKVAAAALALWRAHPQVAAVFTRAEIAATPAPTGAPDSWTLLQEARASFDPARSGDFLVLLKPRITPIADPDRGTVATHGSPWDYDRRVPILFWRKGMAGFEQPNAVETVDIAPTLAALIGLPIATGEMDGRCRDLQPGGFDICGQ